MTVQTMPAHMKHPSIRRLFEYWNERRGRRPLPLREDIEPEAIRCVLADTFILSLAPSTGHPIRVAGTRVCALFGREIRGEAFLNAFCPEAREEMSDLISILADESVGIVASASEKTSEDHAAHFELLLLPLSLNGGGAARVVGALVSNDPPIWPRTHGLTNLTLGNYRFVGAICRPDARPDSVPQSRARPQLIVYEGGRC